MSESILLTQAIGVHQNSDIGLVLAERLSAVYEIRICVSKRTTIK